MEDDLNVVDELVLLTSTRQKNCHLWFFLQLVFNHKQYLKLKIYQEKNDKLPSTTIASDEWIFAMKNTCILIIYSYLDVFIYL